MDNLLSIIAGLTTQLALVKEKLTACEKVKGATEEKKPANTYATISQRMVSTKDTNIMNIGQKPLLSTVKLKNKDKFKTMEEAKISLQKAFCSSWEKFRIKKIIKRKEDIVVETDIRVEALQKLKNSMEIARQFTAEVVNRAKPRNIIYDVPTRVPEDMIKKMIFRQNELDIEWSKFDEECVLNFRMGPKGKKLCNWVLQVSPAVRNTLLANRKLKVDWQLC